MRTTRLAAGGIAALLGAVAVPVCAQDIGAPVSLSDGVTVDPLLAARVRYETVDQARQPDPAQALTVRARIGAELKAAGFSLLAESEGTLALADDYNDTLPGNGVEPFPTVADPESFELNRLQVSYFRDGAGITLGRQRIVLDNARFVGNVGWRQNEQTFDAVRGQARFGPVAIDGSYAMSQRTVFGSDSPNAHYDGDFVLLNAGFDLAAVDAKAFAYLLDYDERVGFSSQTYGVLVTAAIDWPRLGKLDLLASHAVQRDYGTNPVAYQAEYWNAQLSLGLAGFTVTAGYEELGSDRGRAAFQTPLATLHAFNGWADLFLTTPANGLRDRYAGIARSLPFLPGFKAELIYHEFDSDVGGIDYGREWDAALAFRLGAVNLLAKYAHYDAGGFGSDTEKLWLQAEVTF